METLSKGIKKPGSGDRGSTFWTALESNAQQQNDHTHDGNDGFQVSSKTLTRGTQAVSGSGWSSSDGAYRKTITMPSGYTWGACIITAHRNSDGKQIFPDMVKIDATSFYLYMPFNDVAVDLLFT